MSLWRWSAIVIIPLALGTAAAQTDKRPASPAPTAPPVWRQLERFSSDAEFMRYVRDAQAFAGRRYEYFADDAAEEAVMMDGAQPPPPPPPPPPSAVASPAPAQAQAGATLGRAATTSSGESEPSSITNVQTQGVDEGGIVKQIGRYLIMLQDGRLFVVNTRAGDGRRMEFVNRANVYRYPGQDTWYDELLVSGNRVLVTGYSYRERASEITVLRLGDDGQLSREATYYISSNDYYDIENYATRLVNGNLVIYTPLAVSNINVSRPVQWPLIRRWISDGDRQARTTRGRPLFDAQDIYKPVQATRAPVVHSVSVCPLGGDLSGDELECRTTAFVGASQREFFVSTADIYLWVTPSPYDAVTQGGCENEENRTLPATVFQVPLNGAAPRALHARGQPINQLALDASPQEFRALLSMNTGACNRSNEAVVNYFRIPFSAFATTPQDAPRRAYVQTPSPGTNQYEIRYTDTHVVYGGREGYGSSAPPANAAPLSGRVIAVPLARPQNATTLDAPHNIIRVERAGGDAILTGYRTDAGLSVSRVDLDGRPRIVSTQLLRNRYESEGRSHAFNALVREEGEGLMGLPTVTRVKQGTRWWWRSEASDVSFLRIASNGALQDAGSLDATPNGRDPSYQCEVSCVDWYGNTRALFIGDRVFALSATELIEGALVNGRIQERQRLNLSAMPQRVASR